MKRFPLGAFVALLLTACAADAPPPAPPSTIDLGPVYERTDRDFDSAVMFRSPDHELSAGQIHTLAPLIVVQNGPPASQAPVVYWEADSGSSLTYYWDDPATGRQGIHLTVGEDGFPLAVEVLRDSSGARLLFVDQSLEQRATETFGPPLPGRRYSVERSVDETPNVAVGGIFEPGSTPLGPFVYLWEQTHDVNVVLCRCMPPRVFDIVDSIAYTMESGSPSGFEPLALDAALRLSPETDGSSRPHR